MSTIAYLTTYLSLIVFTAAVMIKIISYLKNPIHVRWELYPVAHEGKRAEYGGGYLEEVDWWKKPRNKSIIGELKVMIPEILFLKAVWENNRPLWYVTYPFHLGLYILIVFLSVLIIGAILQLTGIQVGTGSESAFASAVGALTNLAGPLGFLLCIAGAIGLFIKRLTDKSLKDYSSFGHFFNLLLFIIVMTIALITWLFVDSNFMMARDFIANLITFNFASIESSLFASQVIITVVLIAYIPLTHMAHFFMKYFLYHDIRWGDEPNIKTPETDAKIAVVLNYPVSWSADHIKGDGSRKTWAEIATFNPAATPEQEKE